MARKKRLESPKIRLSVALATFNEEENIGDCLESVRQLADEIVVVDESSTDKTCQIAKSYGAKVYKTAHHPIFHVTKQKALDYATGKWILQLDADEKVTPALAKEIKEVLKMDDSRMRKRRPIDEKKWQLFQRHQRLIEKRDGLVGKKTGEIVAFFIPRLNYFLGKPLIHAGVYPDGVIRLVKNGKAWFPAKSVHEQIQINGEVAWLFNDLEHHDSPTLSRYFKRMARYTDLQATDFEAEKIPRHIFGLFYYSVVKPWLVFLNLYARHKGFLDSWRGFLWSFLSALHFPIAYFKYLKRKTE